MHILKDNNAIFNKNISTYLIYSSCSYTRCLVTEGWCFSRGLAKCMTETLLSRKKGKLRLYEQQIVDMMCSGLYINLSKPDLYQETITK